MFLTLGRTPWTEGWPAARPVPTQDSNTERWRQTSVLWARFNS
jgi:hypothetical protein